MAAPWLRMSIYAAGFLYPTLVELFDPRRSPTARMTNHVGGTSYALSLKLHHA
jgi:hypothetical protein